MATQSRGLVDWTALWRLCLAMEHTRPAGRWLRCHLRCDVVAARVGQLLEAVDRLQRKPPAVGHGPLLSGPNQPTRPLLRPVAATPKRSHRPARPEEPKQQAAATVAPPAALAARAEHSENSLPHRTTAGTYDLGHTGRERALRVCWVSCVWAL